MYTIDFLAVENDDSSSTKSGDAIVLNFTVADGSRDAVVVIDGGYRATGSQVVEHVKSYADTDDIDLVICTHPDSDHLNGLMAVLEEANVGELMMHTPWVYASDADVLGNYDNVVALYDLAISKGIPVTQPFTGVSRFNGMLKILGPSEARYVALLEDAIEEERSGTAAARRGMALSAGTMLLTKARNLVERAISMLPIETLTDVDDTSPRNQTSAITLLSVDGHQHLLTGDAGISSLDAAADEYEREVGPLRDNPLSFVQVPHHGSRHNVGPNVLSRLLGDPGNAFATTTAFISSALASEKHPSPKVVNAFSRRGASVFATEGNGICHHGAGWSRSGWSPLTPLPPLEED